MSSEKNILILGIGNMLQSDDGLGPFVIHHILETCVPLPENVEVIDGGTAGFDLVPLMCGRDKIVIVDALMCSGEAGSVYRFRPDIISDSSAGFSLHQAGLKTIINSLKVMGENPDIEIVGIVPEDINTLKIGISDSIKHSIPEAVNHIFDAAAI